MWIYEKKLQFPVHIKETNPKLAQLIISQYGGPDGESAASFRYLSQRFSMKDRKVMGVLTDIGTSVTKLHILFFYKTCFNYLCGVFIQSTR